MMALYILKCNRSLIQAIRSLILPVKRLLAIQGKTVPNCLHLIDSMREHKDINIPKLLNFIVEQARNSHETMRLSAQGLNSKMAII